MENIDNTEKIEQKRLKHNQKNKKYYDNNHEKMLEYQKQKQREYYQKNKAKKLEKSKEYQQKVREVINKLKLEKNVSTVNELLRENAKN